VSAKRGGVDEPTVSESDAALGADLRRLRNARKVSLERLAAHLGWDHGYISRIERGQRPAPALEVLRRWVRFLGGDLRVFVVADDLPLPGDAETRALADAFLRNIGRLDDDKKRLVRGLLESWGVRVDRVEHGRKL
jgi:transcriptional regulator with XRE-family HTH domain